MEAIKYNVSRNAAHSGFSPQFRVSNDGKASPSSIFDMPPSKKSQNFHSRKYSEPYMQSNFRRSMNDFYVTAITEELPQKYK